MKVLIVTTQSPFYSGGAELHAESLKTALVKQGHQAEIAAIPFFWDPPERILDSLMACRLMDYNWNNGNQLDKIIGLKFPAYHIEHTNKTLWILHQHRSAFDLWDSPICDLANSPRGQQIKEAIFKIEEKMLASQERIFANSQNVAKRMKTFLNIDSEALYHPPPQADQFYFESYGDYLYYPSRIERMKRQHLVIEALGLTQEPVKVIFSGKPQDIGYFNELQELAKALKVSDRIEWKGFISDEEKFRLYANCRAVIYPPLDEDYGYVTLEAMLSQKPTITCMDSGGPLEFVDDHKDGWAVEGDPEQIAQAMDEAWKDKSHCQAFGERGHQKYKDLNINWQHVVTQLLK